MSGVVRFKDGAWRIRIEAAPDPITGRRRHLYATVHAPDNKRGRAAADARKAELEVQAAAGKIAPKTGMTVAELIERYIVDRSASWSPGSAEATRARVKHHITPHIGAMEIEKVRRIDIADLHRTWRAGGMTESTAGRVHDIVRAAFKVATLEWEILPRNPTDGIVRPQGKVTEVSPPSAELVVKAMAATRKPRSGRKPATGWPAVAEKDPTLTLYVRLAAVTGARRGQLCATRWSAIDFDAGQIRYTRALAIVPGGVVEKDTKTGKKYPVAIDPATVQLLREHRTRQVETALAVGQPLDRDAYLFTRDATGTAPWHPSTATHRWVDLRRTIPGLEDTRLHDLRHWMATELLNNGFGAVQSAGRGGWSDPTQVHKRYAHFEQARDQAAAEHLAGQLDGTGA